MVAGDEEESVAWLQLQRLRKLGEEALGLLVLLLLARVRDVAGDEDEVGTRPLVAELLGVTQESLERRPAVPAFAGFEVEVGEVEPADGFLPGRCVLTHGSILAQSFVGH